MSVIIREFIECFDCRFNEGLVKVTVTKNDEVLAKDKFEEYCIKRFRPIGFLNPRIYGCSQGESKEAT